MEMITAGAQYMFQALRPDPALHNQISKLRAALPMSELLIERSECWRFKHKVIDVLLPQLKDATYEAQTVLNEFTYQELKQRVEEETQQKSFAGEIISSSRSNFRNWWSGYTTKVKEVQDRLDYVYGQLKEACDKFGIPENPNTFSKTARPMTSSFVAEHKVYGRDKEVNDVIHMLGVPSIANTGSNNGKRSKKEKVVDLSESSSIENKKNVSVLSIVGIGGVGKTTLAQMVCTSKEVRSHFGLIIWICVSDNFDVARLTKEIIECATKKACDIDNLNSLQETLKATVESKRFLLILDDVWSESRSDWHHLFGPLKEGCEGSKVIVTTRSLKIATIMSIVRMDFIILEGLDRDIYWEFFRSCAFGPATNSEKYPELKKIGEQIIVKLKGSPLAAKTLGGLLSTELSEKHWRNIKDSEIWELQQEEDGILPVLQLSYQYLPSYLKKCFSFCSLFPKDYKFSEDKLIRFWISKGFIASQQIRQMEIVAKGYFRELVNRYFFQNTIYNEYVIHDLMHNVSQSITKDECFRIESGTYEKKIYMDIRHVSVFNEKFKMDKLKRICKCEKLYTLKIDENNICVFNPINSWFNELTNICSLSLTNCKIVNLPDSIGNLKHLWYLDISGTNIKQLPNSFCDLYKLEILDTEHCQLLECFPEGSNKLISMKLLILPELIYDNVETTKVSLVGHMPNLANLIKLKELTFAVTKEKGNTIETLKHINGIYYKMRIVQLENVSNKEEAEQAQLNKKEFVKWLELSWSTIIVTDSISNDHAAVLEGLCPHPNLENLEILSYRGENLQPTWLKAEILTNLTTIIIAYCINITTIPCLPHSLTRFDVRGCKRLTSLQDCLVPSNLPSLKRIEIWTCEELVTMAVETFHEFIYLQELRISHCSKLTCQRETVLPLSLKLLYLASCGELEEQFFCSLQNLTSITRLKIKECPRITSILLENLKSLEKLEISNCSQLQSVGVREHFALKHVSFYSCPKLKSLELGNLKSLEHLELMFCRKLQSIGGQELLASVRYIRISSCQELKSLELDNLKSLERLQLSECSELQSVRARELLVSLKYIRINSCSNLKSLELDNLNSLEKLEVSRCNQLRSIGGLELLASLKYIGIRSCEELKSLELGNLKSLENLEVMDCSELRSIGGRELLTSVKEINIYLCPKLEETNGKDLEI